ncbi:hypothetical protein TBLA_0C02240 [Henningerozyma blattae CBS 6284]|uniref:Uncharacterized protein n=1 Tax=Henningerozyma blattae (strain ATCC 34711 / CBS 6284 / DSM 70876 / NBRC 10599 / NRRL Y-10934 / UCD 77-7) TaxID=1071380 RepID=I2H0Y4_HENB6|nr:hypothetical protein TBLA_0C02240 [Tetrapisispora blattae CBS 6284]CCH60036.1 hypothetical protein TBLA_0C02240 [Tetrapisispora blattae CBS 6284]
MQTLMDKQFFPDGRADQIVQDLKQEQEQEKVESLKTQDLFQVHQGLNDSESSDIVPSTLPAAINLIISLQNKNIQMVSKLEQFNDLVRINNNLNNEINMLKFQYNSIVKEKINATSNRQRTDTKCENFDELLALSKKLSASNNFNEFLNTLSTINHIVSENHSMFGDSMLIEQIDLLCQQTNDLDIDSSNCNDIPLTPESNKLKFIGMGEVQLKSQNPMITPRTTPRATPIKEPHLKSFTNENNKRRRDRERSNSNAKVRDKHPYISSSFTFKLAERSHNIIKTPNNDPISDVNKTSQPENLRSIYASPSSNPPSKPLVFSVRDISANNTNQHKNSVNYYSNFKFLQPTDTPKINADSSVKLPGIKNSNPHSRKNVKNKNSNNSRNNRNRNSNRTRARNINTASNTVSISDSNQPRKKRNNTSNTK